MPLPDAKTAFELPPPDISIDQESGARWSVYHHPDSLEGFTIVTSSGAELAKKHEEHALRGLLHQYRAAEIGSIMLLGRDPGMRQELGRGQEATVYSMGPFAVREVIGIPSFYTAIGELQRMDAINSAIEGGLPRWLNLPVHYALHADPEQQKTYTLMDRIDGGMTVEDVVDYPDVKPNRATLVEHELGEELEDAQIKVPELYDAAYEVLSEAIRKSGRNPDNYLTDWKPRNVIVEGRLPTPVAGSHYKLSVIDQYRS